MKCHLLIPVSVTMIVVLAAMALGASPATKAAGASTPLSELLEKGIYTEETVGDVDAAMKIYEQVLAEAKTMRSVGAQAQYRLALCFLKRQKKAEAQAAFEKLIKEYPEAKELVAKARKHLPDELVMGPEPWVDGEVLPLTIKLPSGRDFGTFTYTVESAKVEKQDVWRVQIRRFILAGGNNQGISRVDADRKTFRPIRSLFKHTILGTFETVYRPNEADVIIKTEGKDKTKQTELDGPVYDNEQAMHLIRRLPLAVGYKATVPVFVPFGTGNLPVGIEVPSIETLEVPAGKFECFKIELSIKQTLWFSTDSHRYIVKFEAEGVSGELSAIQQIKPGAKNKFADESLGLSLTAPPGWLFYRSEKGKKKSEVTVFLLDPEAVALSVVDVKPLENLKPEQKASVRAWAESEVSELKEGLKDFKLRQESWQERKMAGLPVVSVIADFVEGKRKMVAYGVFIFGKSKALAFHTQTDLESFDAFKPTFDTIVESFKVQ